MKNPVIITVEMRDNFDDEFLLAYARMVIAFGRLESIVKLAIKDLVMSMNNKANFTAGIAEAENKFNFPAMADHMLALYREKNGQSDKGKEPEEWLERWVEEAKKWADLRNRIIHSSLTIDDNGALLLMHTKLNKKEKAVEFNELTLDTKALQHMHKKIEELWQGINVVRQEWTSV